MVVYCLRKLLLTMLLHRSSVKVGTTAFTVEQLVDNIKVVLARVIDLIPRKRRNVQTIFLKVGRRDSVVSRGCVLVCSVQ